MDPNTEALNAPRFSLDDIPVVVVDTENNYKFIMIQLTDTTGATKIIVRGANQKCEYHEDIHEKFWKNENWKSKGILSRVLGGGFLSISKNTQIINIWNKSGQYGREPDRELTAQLVREAFPGYTVTVR